MHRMSVTALGTRIADNIDALRNRRLSATTRKRLTNQNKRISREIASRWR